jgi:hypothetical protein
METSKERNKRVFEGVSALLNRIVALIKKELHIRMAACGESGEPVFLR